MIIAWIVAGLAVGVLAWLYFVAKRRGTTAISVAWTLEGIAVAVAMALTYAPSSVWILGVIGAIFGWGSAWADGNMARKEGRH
ncbi:MAG: hypothetical protein DLM71_04900 [Chloroflexi bacterium]|nr:hypothetical protein [Candidatus Dormibacteraeota bacterium]PZR63253.1 MAG: hypothetical protein DLM71_04900 [Chloroflexota bacterium]